MYGFINISALVLRSHRSPSTCSIGYAALPRPVECSYDRQFVLVTPRNCMRSTHRVENVSPLSLESEQQWIRLSAQAEEDGRYDDLGQLEKDVGGDSFGGASGSSSGGSGGGGRGDDPDDKSRGEILAQYGKAEMDIPDDVRTLTGESLGAYLRSTKGGLSGWLARFWPGWRRRVAADPEFPFKLLMEETIGLGLTASGMLAARGRRILSELDFAICDMSVGATMNFVLVYLLTPALGARTGGPLSRLPANLFAKGAYSFPARIGGFFYRGALFAGCGFAASIVGTSASQVLVAVRRAVSDGDSTSQPRLPNVFVNSAAWAGFMFVSSSPRYQTVAGVERLLFSFAPEAVAKLSSAALRTGNNIIGGITWVAWARAIGLQKVEDSSDVSEDVPSINIVPAAE